MDEFIDEVSRLRETLQFYIEPYGLPIEAFEKAGSDGFTEFHEQGRSRENAIFANDLADKIESVPLVVVQSMCLAAIYLLVGERLHNNSQPDGLNCLVRGEAEISFIRGLSYGVQMQDSQKARIAAFARHANDPKQESKAMVRECWDAWKIEPSRYKGKAAFAKDMRDKFPNLESQPVIERWCRNWEQEI